MVFLSTNLQNIIVKMFLSSYSVHISLLAYISSYRKGTRRR
ncbi:hypothetical protein SAMN04488689_102203 [Paenibacillus sp. cl6col]|nr:hypothetical protein SAMN04488689_102203 [Paenibacillus sp. cl6col]